MLAIMVVVTGYPLLNTIWLSFTDTRLVGAGEHPAWVGFENFAYALTDSDFRRAVLVSLYFTFASVTRTSIQLWPPGTSELSP